MLFFSWRLVWMTLAALVFLAMVGLLIRRPELWAKRLLSNAVLGFGAGWLLNLCFQAQGFGLTWNLCSILFTGCLGVPGVALVAALQAFLA